MDFTEVNLYMCIVHVFSTVISSFYRMTMMDTGFKKKKGRIKTMKTDVCIDRGVLCTIFMTMCSV